MKYIPYAVLWVTAAILNAGFLNADFRGRFPALTRNPDWTHHNCADALGINLPVLPVAVVMTPFLTGFYYHGWTLSCSPEELP